MEGLTNGCNDNKGLDFGIEFSDLSALISDGKRELCGVEANKFPLFSILQLSEPTLNMILLGSYEQIS